MVLRLALLLTWASLASCFLAPLSPSSSPCGGVSMRGMGLSTGATSRRSALRTLSKVRMLGTDDKVSVAVIGGGPAGLAAANTLLDVESVGSVTVIEKLENFSEGPDSWGIGLGNRSRTLLSSMTGNPWKSNLEHNTLRAPSGFYRGTHSVIRSCLQEALDAHPGAAGGRLRVELGTTVTTYDTDNKRLSLDNGGDVSYDCLVLADGSHSPSTRALGLESGIDRLAFDRCLKAFKVPSIEGDDKTYFFTGPNGTSHWLMSLKGGRRQLINFWELDDAAENTRNFAGVASAAEMRAYLKALTPVVASNASDAPDWASYWDGIDEATLQACFDRDPRVMWSGFRRSTVDERRSVVMVGDAAGSLLPSLGQGTSMAFQDAVNLKKSFLQAEEEVGAKGGGKDELVKSVIKHWKHDGEKDRKAMVKLCVIAAAALQKLATWLPGLQRASRYIQNKVEDPAVKPHKLFRNPLLWVLSKITYFLWVRRWGKDEDYVRRWRKRF